MATPLQDLNAALDTLDGSTNALDLATTELANEIAALAERVKNDDIPAEELAAVLERLSGNAAAVSSSAATVSANATTAAGIEAAAPDPEPEPEPEPEPTPEP